MSHDDTGEHLVGGLPSYYPSSKNSNNYKLLKPIADLLDEQGNDIETVDLASTVQTIGTDDLTIPPGETTIIPDDDRWFYRSVYIEGTLLVRGELLAKSVEVDGEVVTENGGLVNSDTQYRREMLTQLETLGSLISVPPRENEDVEHYRARLIAEFSLITGKATIETLISTAAEILDTNPRSISFSEPYSGEHGTAEIGLPISELEAQELTDAEVVEILDRIIPAGYRLNGLRTGTFTYISPEDYQISNFNPDRGYDGLDSNDDPKGNGGTYAGVIQ